MNKNEVFQQKIINGFLLYPSLKVQSEAVSCKTEWAFDYTGKIFSCTATVGKADESLGTFYPVITLKEAVIEQWEARDVTSIPECKECAGEILTKLGCDT